MIASSRAALVGPPWFERAFGADYPRVYPQRDLAAARAEALQLVGLGLGGRVLDLCCGRGRHTLALAELGLQAVGVDLSAPLLAAAERGHRLVRGDARALPFQGGRFDALVCLFSSFGYLDEEGDAGVLREARRVLRPGGLAVFDLLNPNRVRARLVPVSVTRRDGWEVREWRALAPGARGVQKEVRLTAPDGSRRGWTERVRLYRADELARLFAACGFGEIAIHGDLDARPLEPLSPRLVVAARA